MGNGVRPVGLEYVGPEDNGPCVVNEDTVGSFDESILLTRIPAMTFDADFFFLDADDAAAAFFSSKATLFNAMSSTDFANSNSPASISRNFVNTNRSLSR